MFERLSGAFWSLIERRTIAVFALLIVVASALVLWQSSKISENLVESTSLANAALYSEAIEEFRSLYTSEVVDTARKHGILVTHDYKDHEGAIPLPATLSKLLGEKIGERHSGAKSLLYSPYPFPWRKVDGGLRDDFAREAWAALSNAPDRPFTRFEVVAGEPVLRYATADRMRERCVDCHNSHPDSPKRDWQVGDTRGVLEVDFPMKQASTQTEAGLTRNSLLVGGLVVAGIGLLAGVMRRLKGTSRQLAARAADLHSSEERIRGMNQELERLNGSLEKLVQERTDEARRHRKTAQEASETKGLFLATMSHELRTPMNAIIGYSEMLLEEAEKGSAANADLERIRGAGKHLLGLINGILDLSRFEEGQLEMLIEDFDLTQMTQDVAATVRPLAERAKDRLDIACPSDIGTMRADLTRVRQVLFHLLSNACKFTSNGTIALALEPFERGGAGWVRMIVKDTGIGMTAEQTQVLFQDFTQVDPALTRKYGGMGLGLAISRRFCHMLGGELRVESEYGKGSTFTVDLPRRVKEPEERAKAEAGAPLHEEAGPATGDVVLVIDDDPAVRGFMRSILISEGYGVACASSAEEGLRLAGEAHPAVILLDDLMPSQDGWALLKRLKSTPELASIPVLMVTTLDSQSMGAALGAVETLVKPVNRDALVRLLEKHRTPVPPSEVLVVEDDGATRDMIERVLRKERVTVVTAENGRIGIDRMRDHHPSLVLLDLLMPEMDGFEFLKRLREDPTWQQTPVIVMTAKDLTAAEHTLLADRAETIVRRDAGGLEPLKSAIRQHLRAAAPVAGRG